MPVDEITEPTTWVRAQLGRVRGLVHHDREYSILSATVLLGAALIMSRLLGFAREAYIAYAFGAQQQTDAYIAAYTIPDILYSLLAGGTLSITLTLVLTRYEYAEGEKDTHSVFSVIFTIMASILLGATVLAEIFAPQFARLLFPKFDPNQLRLCVRIIRILLPARLFLYIGTMLSAVLLSMRRFFLPAVSPLVINIGVLGVAVLMGGRIGVVSLAVGNLLGTLVGPCLLHGMAVRGAGYSYRPSFDFHNPGLREWLSLSLPMMVSVSLFSADNWFVSYFASGLNGDITRIHYAKQLLFVPVALFGSTSSEAAVPFLGKLFSQRRFQEFEQSLNRAVYAVSAATLLAASWLISVSLPLCDVVLRRGRFEFADSQKTALYLSCMAISLVFWSLIMTYSRGLSAAMDTVRPAVVGTLTVLAFFPIYGLLFHVWSTMGLAIAPCLATAANVAVLATLTHRKGLARFTTLSYGEIGKSLGIAVAGAIVGHFANGIIRIDGTRGADIKAIAVDSACWFSVVALGLWITRSSLLNHLSGWTGLRLYRKLGDEPSPV
jgi:putative peptidoglycan lipid II flippase